jgi:hypothetical protein
MRKNFLHFVRHIVYNIVGYVVDTVPLFIPQKGALYQSWKRA